jgi:hypothetical protein
MKLLVHTMFQHPVTSTDPDSNIPINTPSHWVTFRCLSRSSSSLSYGATLHTLYLRISHAGQRSVSLTEQSSITDADGLELADRPVELLSANSAKQINESHAVPQKSRRQTRCNTSHARKSLRWRKPKLLRHCERRLKVDYAVYSTHTARRNLHLHYLLQGNEDVPKSSSVPSLRNRYLEAYGINCLTFCWWLCNLQKNYKK